MNLDINSKLLHEAQAESGAEHLLTRLRKGDMSMEVLSNLVNQYSDEQEEKNYISYWEFLHSLDGKRILSILEEADAQ